MTELAAPAPRRSFLDLGMISLGHGLTHWYPATFFLLLPIITKEFGLTYSQVGFIMFVDSFTTAVANVPAGMLIDIVGRRRLLMSLALFAVGVPYLLLSVSGSYWLVILCVTFTGVGNNLWHPTAIPTLSEIYPERKGLALSVHALAANLGDALAPVAVGAALAWVTWRHVVVWNLIPGVALGAATLLVLRNLAEPAHSAGGKKGARQLSWAQYVGSLKVALRSRGLVFITLLSGLRSMTQKTLVTFLPLYLAGELGYSPFLVGFGMFVLQAAGFVASPLFGHMSDRVGRWKTLVVTTAATAVAVVVMGLMGRSELFIALVAVAGFFLFAIRPVMQAWMMEVSPKETMGTSVGLLFGVQGLGNSVGPLAAGLLADRFGLGIAFYFVAATILVANLLLFVMPKEIAAQGAGKETA